MDQQTELTPVLRITTGIELIQRGINDMDRAGVAAQALSEIDQCLARLRSAFADLPESIVTHEKARCDGCQHYVRDVQQLAVGDGAYPEVSAWCDVSIATDCPAAKACGFGNEGK